MLIYRPIPERAAGAGATGADDRRRIRGHELARPAQTLIGDRNYFGRGFEHELAEQGIPLLRSGPQG